jgi:hypothetical protein
MGALPISPENINYGLKTIANWKKNPEKYSMIHVHIVIIQIGEMLDKKYSFDDINKIEADLLKTPNSPLNNNQ